MLALEVETLTQRIRDHKRVLVNIVKPKICTERARHYTEAYRLHMDKPLPVRRALALALHLQKKQIWIKNDELIVGNQASDLRAAPIFPEYTVTWIEQEIDELASRPGAGFGVSEEDKRIIHEVCPFWHGLTVHDRSYGLFTDEQKRILATTLMKIEGNMNAGDGHLAVNYERVLQLGIDGFKTLVAERRSRVDLSDWQGLHQEQFLKGVAIVLEALSSYIDRYARLASNMADDEQRSWRRDELKQIAANFTLIAHRPPETFWQAGGVLLNQKLNPSAFATDTDYYKLMAMLRTFFSDHKGWHVQYNVVSRETLLAAKAHPDQYRDLVVRVAGYSAFFTALSPDMQDDIIARTEHVL